MADENQTSPQDRERELAALSYLWIFSVIVLFSKRENIFIQHHARQGFVLFILSLLLWPIDILRYGEFVVLALSVLGFISAAMGNELHIPIIREMADGTLRLFHLRRYWHHTKHGAIKMIKEDHATPLFREELKEQHKELTEQERELERERKMVEMEEKKLSALNKRVTDDEKRLDQLSDEVHTLETKVDKMEEK